MSFFLSLSHNLSLTLCDVMLCTAPTITFSLPTFCYSKLCEIISFSTTATTRSHRFSFSIWIIAVTLTHILMHAMNFFSNNKTSNKSLKMCNLIKRLTLICIFHQLSSHLHGLELMKSRYVHEQESYFSNVNLTHTNTILMSN